MDRRKLVEFCFYQENNIRRAIYEKRNDRVKTVTGGAGGRCRISDPTAVEGMRAAEEIQSVLVEYGAATAGARPTLRLYHPERWLTVIDATKEHFSGTKYGELIRMRYGESAVRREVCRVLEIAPTIHTTMVNTILDYATGYADCLQIDWKY